MNTRNHAGNDAYPRAKQNPAGHHRDNTYVHQRAFYGNAGPGAEQGEQRENGGRAILLGSAPTCATVRETGGYG